MLFAHLSRTGRLLFAAGVFAVLVPFSAAGEIHVALDGKDDNPGTRTAPLRTVQRGAELAQPGDTVTVHSGIYRERVNPPRGGLSDTQRIVFQAAPGEKVEIRGSEPVSAWERVEGQSNVWKTVVPNAFFGGFNPYADEIKGHWFEPKERKHHTGAVYIDGEWLIEAASLEDLFKEPGASAKPVGGYLFNLAWFAIGAGTEAKRIPAATHSASAGVQPAKLAAAAGVEGEGLGWIEDGDWARYDNLPLDGATTLSFQVSSASSGGALEARADSPGGKLLGRIQVKPTGDWGEMGDCRNAAQTHGGRPIALPEISAHPGSGRGGPALVRKGGKGGKGKHHDLGAVRR